MRLGVAAALVAGAVRPGDIEIEEGRIVGVGLAPAGSRDLAVAGFVDVQVNGFAGVDFLTADAAEYAKAGAALARSGVTAYQPTLISSPLDTCRAALATLASLDGVMAGPRILPAHLEGPFLSPIHHGAHDPRHLLDADIGIADLLCDAGPVGYMTVAPEIPGGLGLVEHLAGRGIVVALGHSHANVDTAVAAFDRGARGVTHIFNAMRRWAARDPGLPGVALTRSDVTITAIVDTVHLAAETVRLLLAAARGRLVLITDAIEAAGLGDGTYHLGDRVVHVKGLEARLGDRTLAGSVLSMDQAVRNLMLLGAGLETALDAATRVPARLLGRADLGDLRVGGRADVVVLDDAVGVRRTLVGGEEVFAA